MASMPFLPRVVRGVPPALAGAGGRDTQLGPRHPEQCIQNTMPNKPMTKVPLAWLRQVCSCSAWTGILAISKQPVDRRQGPLLSDASRPKRGRGPGIVHCAVHAPAPDQVAEATRAVLMVEAAHWAGDPRDFPRDPSVSAKPVVPTPVAPRGGRR